MTAIVLDDHLSSPDVRGPLASWTTVQFLREVRPQEVIKDERVPAILRTLQRPTFVTIDDWFWNRNRRAAHYCIVYIALREDEQQDLPALLRRLFRHAQFRTRALRMGKVIRVSRERVMWWQLGDERQRTSNWFVRSG
ncbi:MAG: hypothetical protein ACYDCQ_08235 [Dehalococcoidia bacterium]